MSAVRKLEELIEEQLALAKKRGKKGPSDSYFRKSSIEAPPTTVPFSTLRKVNSNGNRYDPSLDQASKEQGPSPKGTGGAVNSPSPSGPFKSPDDTSPFDKGRHTRQFTAPALEDPGKETYPFGGGSESVRQLPEPGSRILEQPQEEGRTYLKERPKASEQAQALQEKFNNPLFTNNYFDEYLSRDNEQTNFTLSLPPSSTIQTANYYPDSDRLEVSFKSGETYLYDGVPISVVSAWQKAASAGSFFYHNIRMAYRYYSSRRSEA